MLNWNKYPAAMELCTPRDRDTRERGEVDSGDLKPLPPIAISTFAYRCAKRVRPLASGVGDEYLAALDECLAFAEERVTTLGVPSIPKEAISRIHDDYPWFDHAGALDATRFVTEAVLHSVDAAATRGVRYGIAAARAAHDAWLCIAGAAVQDLDAMHLQDVEMLIRRTRDGAWTDSTTIDPSSMDEELRLPPLPNSSAPFDRQKPPAVAPTHEPSAIASSLPHLRMRSLPDHAYIALSSRHAMRLVELLPQNFRRGTFEALRALQEVAEFGFGDPLLPLSNALCNIADSVRPNSWQISDSDLNVAARALYALGRCVRCVWAEASVAAESFARTAIVLAERAVQDSGTAVSQELQQDVAAVVAYAKNNEKRFRGRFGGVGRGRFPQDIFASFALFDTTIRVDGNSILELSPIISGELIGRIAEHPRMLHELHPREFEEMLARVFEMYGFDVELTQETRDGGRDIIAIGHQPARVKYLIECKKYAEDNTVGLAVVQRLHGVVHGDAGSKGIVATTSRFTKPALDYMERSHIQYQLEGRDFEGVHRWLIAADRMRLARKSLGTHFTMTPSGMLVPQE